MAKNPLTANIKKIPLSSKEITLNRKLNSQEEIKMSPK